MLCAAVLTVLLTAARAQVANFEFPVTKESVLFITIYTRQIISKVLYVMKTTWCDSFYLIYAIP